MFPPNQNLPAGAGPGNSPAQPGAATPDPFADLMQQAMNEYVQNHPPAGQPAPPPPPQPQPIKMNIAGEERMFNSIDEANQFVNRTLAQAAEVVQQAARQRPPEPLPGQVVRNEDETKFGQDEMKQWVDTLAEHPVKAIEKAMDRALGVEGSFDLLKASIAETAANKRVLAAYAFQDAHPEYPAGDARTAKLMGDVVNQVGLPFTPEGLEAAWGIMLQRGLAQPRTGPGASAHPYAPSGPMAAMPGPAPVPPPPPGIGRGPYAPTTPASDLIEQLATGPLDQLEAVINKLSTGQ